MNINYQLLWSSVINRQLLYFSGAFISFVSLKPYIFWYPSHWLWSIIFTIIYLSIASFYFIKDKTINFIFEKKYSILMCFLFLTYISILKKYDGNHKLWFLIIPIIFFYLNLNKIDLEKTFNCFKFIYIISLIPAILYQIMMICGIKFSFNILESTEYLKKVNGVGYLEFPGVVFQSTCSYSLTNIGNGFIDIHKSLPSQIISRLCALYVEPGVVGTLSILFLATCKNFKNISSVLLIISGFMSLSLAFIVSFIILLFLRKEGKILISCLIGISTLILVIFKFESNEFVKSNITNRITLIITNNILNTEDIYNKNETKNRNKRESAEFEKIMDTCFQSPTYILFGIASDASEYSDCSTYRLVLSNYGLTGLLLLLLFFGAILYEYQNKKDFNSHIEIFLLIFFINFLQRPYIWMPFYILIYIYGISCKKENCNEIMKN